MSILNARAPCTALHRLADIEGVVAIFLLAQDEHGGRRERIEHEIAIVCQR